MSAPLNSENGSQTLKPFPTTLVKTDVHYTVIKRDGTKDTYSKLKIRTAINKSYLVCLGFDLPLETERNIQNYVKQILFTNPSRTEASVENIQDAVETALMRFAPPDVCKSYILYRTQRNHHRVKGYDLTKIPDNVHTPWGAIGYVTFKRTYARAKTSSVANGNNDTTESFRDTILRVLTACQNQLHVDFTVDELKDAYKYMMALKGTVSGRFLWQLGTQTVEKFGLMSLQNCAFVRIDDPIRPFLWTFDVLMLGCGVGVSVERKNVSKLPLVLPRDQENGACIQVTRNDVKDADFIVSDKREGWVSLLERTLTAFFVTGKSFTYSTILIRNKGAPIKGFGGTASGPEDLCKGIGDIVGILQSRQGSQLSPVDCLDIINIIGYIVVSGNIRRSALLVIGDADDEDYLKAKRWDLGGIPNWRAMSNNSVACSNPADLPEVFWEGYEGKGEPYGLVNPMLARECGRLADGDKYPDPECEGFNPCAEQSLCNYESCCLSEIFLPNIKSKRELFDVGITLYRISKHSLRLPCHHPETQAIVHRNMRMGIGITGYLQCDKEKQGWLGDFYEHLRAFDVEYSAKHGFPTSIKLTTVKPSGTLSLLAGVTPGVHPGIYQYFLRRIRISSTNPLVDLCKSRGYACEFQLQFDGTADVSTTVVAFPCKYPEGTRLAAQMSAIDQLEVVKRMQTEYSDNSVSCTVYYRLSELGSIREWLAGNYANGMKGVSFLLHSEHGFKQAPYEEITKDEYDKLCARCKPITDGLIHTEEDYSIECAQGACPVK